MTYMIVNGTADKVEFTFDDGGCCSEGWYADTYEKVCDSSAESALTDGNYYTGSGSVGRWNEDRRRYVHDQWLKLKNLIKEQLDKTGEVHLEFLNYFTEYTSEDPYRELANQIRIFARKVEQKKIPLRKLIEISLQTDLI